MIPMGVIPISYAGRSFVATFDAKGSGPADAAIVACALKVTRGEQQRSLRDAAARLVARRKLLADPPAWMVVGRASSVVVVEVAGWGQSATVETIGDDMAVDAAVEWLLADDTLLGVPTELPVEPGDGADHDGDGLWPM